MDVGIAVGHHLVCLLRGGIERDRMLRRMVLGEGLTGVRPVNRTRGGVDQMAGLGPKGSLEDIPESYQVRVDVGEGIFQGVPDPDLGGKVVDDGKRLALEEPQEPGPVHDIHAVEGKALPGKKAGEAGLLEGDLVVVVQVVDPHHRMAHREESVGEGGSDEAGRASDKDFHKDLAIHMGTRDIKRLTSNQAIYGPKLFEPPFSSLIKDSKEQEIFQIIESPFSEGHFLATKFPDSDPSPTSPGIFRNRDPFMESEARPFTGYLEIDKDANGRPDISGEWMK